MAEYIEREKAIANSREYNLGGSIYNTERAVPVDAINSIPAADVRPVVRAHWYWDKDGMDWGIGAWRCSACKTMSPMWWNADRGSPMHKSGHRYCPNCGAAMEES